jgi:hypothetical protein
MKQSIWMVLIGGVLIQGAALDAAPRKQERQRFASRTKASLLLVSQTRPDAAAYYDAPPPAPGAEVGTVLPPPPGQPVPQTLPAAPGGQPLPMAAALPLFPCVKYRDERNIAPCAVPMCVAVRDPCDDHCSCGAPPRCVMVQICVPTCGCAKISCKHDGEKVRYDYGKYRVDITSKRGVVVVDYDD